MKTNRDIARTLHNGRYRRIGRAGDDCLYCGAYADTEDHVPPLSWAGLLDPGQGVLFLRVPSCSECNGLLGGAPVSSLSARCWEAKKRLHRRYRKTLNLPDWEPEDLEEMSPEMRRDIENRLKLAGDVRARLAYPVFDLFD